MRRRSLYPIDPTLNLDWINDDWLWLFEPAPEIEDTVWTSEEIEHLYDALLQDSLRNLIDPRCSQNTRHEIYLWMVSDTDRNPFSFKNCCAMTGLDPDEVRSLIEDKITEKARH